MDNEAKSDSSTYNKTEWIGYGVVIGVVLGLAFDNLAMGIAFGIAIGAGLNSYLGTESRNCA